MFEKHRSVQYNPNIARGFFWAGYIETWGRGIEKICDACHTHGSPEPVYTVYPEDIMVMFKAKKIDKVTGKLSENVIDELTERQRRILRYIINNNSITSQEMSQEMSQEITISERTTKRDLAALQKIGILRRVGPNKGGYWEIIKK